MADLWGDESGVLFDLGGESLNTASSMQRMTELAAAAMRTFTKSGVGCAATLVQGKRAPLVAASSDAAGRCARLEARSGTGPITEALEGGVPISLSDAGTDVRWPAYRELLVGQGCSSVLSVPVQLESGLPCVLTYFATEPNVFGPEALRRAGQIGAVAARSLDSAFLVQSALSTVENLQAALEGRTSISIACGIIMAQNGCSYQEAFGILAKASSHRNVKLRKVAEGILEGLPGGAPTASFGMEGARPPQGEGHGVGDTAALLPDA